MANYYIKYRNINDEMMGPFQLKFDAFEEHRKNEKKQLITLGHWVDWDDRKEYERWGFVHLLGSRCAISKVRYRHIQETKKSEWYEIELPYLTPKCDLANINPNAYGAFAHKAFYYYKENPGLESDFYLFTHIEVQIIFYDGEESMVKKFTRPPTR